jgi:dihydrolipoamide dehydrogenase
VSEATAERGPSGPLSRQDQTHFDVVVLGGGPGGYAAALYGAAAGLDIAMVEERRVGGTCLHVGCIPAKELLETATVLRTVQHAADFGISTGPPAIDLSVSQRRKQAVIDRLTKGLEGLLKQRKVTVHPVRGEVASVDDRRIRLADGSEITGDALILATGSLPRTLPGFDFDGRTILSSDHVLALDHVPERVAVIGGGAIGCEFASYFVDVGSRVTILEALPQILTGVDVDAANVAVRAFKKRGIAVQTGVKVRGQAPGPNGVTISYETADGQAATLDVDVVVVSVGRRPRSEGVGLEGTAVTVDDRGFVKVDGSMRTTAEGVYAVGDLVPGPQLAHVAFAEAIVAIQDILGESPVPIEYDKVPWGIYCHPEVAFCGLTEAQAKAAGLDVVVKTSHFAGNGRALIIGESDGIVKVVAERDGPIVGVHITGPWATELLAEGYLSVNWEATPGEVGAFIHPHPSLSEVFGETALSLTGRGLHG